MSNNLDNLKINYYSSNNISFIAIKENLSEVEDFKKFKREYNCLIKIVMSHYYRILINKNQ